MGLDLEDGAKTGLAYLTVKLQESTELLGVVTMTLYWRRAA